MEPPRKRQRRGGYCYCGNCRGQVQQNPRTIRDHQKRYPEPQASAEAESGNENLPDSMEDPPPDDLPIRPSPPASPMQPLPPSSPSSPDGSNRPYSLFGDEIERPPSPPNPGTPLGLPDRPRRRRVTIEEIEDEDVPVVPEVQREYRFDRLLQRIDEEEDMPFPNLGLGCGFDEDDDYDPENAQDDEDFGLPDGNEAPAIPEFQFQFPDEDVDPDDEDEEDDDPGPRYNFAAFDEPDPIRHAYTDAFIQKSLYGATHRALRHQLRTSRRTLASHPDINAEDLAKMAQTIGTAERRLGINTDEIITTFTLCPRCKRRYHPDYILHAPDATCLNANCDASLFTTKRLAFGRQRRVSHLTYPFASPIAWLRQVLSLPGKAELMQSWRQSEDDKEELTKPVLGEDWVENLDPDESLGDISDGWGWRSTYAGLERRIDPDTGDVQDESGLPEGRQIRFVSLPFGISLTLNTDWFRATKEGSYSVGACYLAINNLPRHMRFLRENICLAIVMPGPSEPSDYALDQMLEPLVDELLKLKDGVRMTIRQGDPATYREQVVHAELSQHIADLMARIKMGGGAGLKSELNFCLYCRSRLSSLSVAAGFCREDFDFRDPAEDLDNAYFWKSLQTAEERKAFFDFTGNRYTALHRLPGWHTSTCSPLDAMHLLYLGGMNWIIKQILVGPGMLSKRHPDDQDPIDLFNSCLDTMWIPKNYGRLPPKLGQTRGTIKADQLKLASRLIFVPLYLAMRDGDSILPEYVPRGTARSIARKHQDYRAKLLHQHLKNWYEHIGQPRICPKLEACYPSRSLCFHYQQVLRFCLVTSTLDKRTITSAEITFAQNLLETLCLDYVHNHVPLPPNFHYMMHFEESMLKTGSIYNTHVWAMERANGIVSKISHNGKTKGILEGTLMRGWWSHAMLQNLITAMNQLPNRTPADNEVLADLLKALKGGAEHADQRGSLMAFIAKCQTDYMRLRGVQDSTRLSRQSRVINLETIGVYREVVEFCMNKWPNAGIFGPGMPEERYLPPVGVARNHSYVEHDGIRYGSYHHTSGKGYCYGYVDGRYPARIERILSIVLPGEPELRTICVLVRTFRAPTIEPLFPWNAWSIHLGVSSWAYNRLGNMIAISVERFSGNFALFDVPTSRERYWVTVSLDNISPERDDDDEDDDDD